MVPFFLFIYWKLLSIEGNAMYKHKFSFKQRFECNHHLTLKDNQVLIDF